MSQDVNTVDMFNRAYERLMAMAKADPQVAELVPDDKVSKAIREPGLSYQEVIAITLAGYADRAALGVRAHEVEVDELTGRRARQVLPAYRTITYRELARQIEAIANCWRDHPRLHVAPGEFVNFISFSGAEMTALDLACVYAQTYAVPVQANLPPNDVMEIFKDTQPGALVASIDNLELAISYALKQETIRSLIVIDSEELDDSERDRLASARQQLTQEGERVALATFGEVVAYGKTRTWSPLPKAAQGLDRMAMLMYTSGSTGTPKGAIVHEAMCTQLWNGVARCQPTITVSYAPFNHFAGRMTTFTTLGQGGTAYFSLKSDMSTLLEDIRLVRPTWVSILPRVCEIIYQHYQSEVQRRIADGGNLAEVDRQVRAEMSKTYLGDRLIAAGTGSSPTAPEVQDFIRECFDIAFIEGYGSTEAGGGATTAANIIQRNVITDYKLRDVPELGYYTTDKPYPRGELLVKSRLTIHGYFKRPEASAGIMDPDGYLLTGDIMEERGPDHVVWVDRRNNVIKLSQAEFVAIGPLEAVYVGRSALISQIFLYGSSYRSFLLAVVVPNIDVARARLGRKPTGEEMRALVLADFQDTARTAKLKSFEVPRDVLIDMEPFTLENGLLSSARKPLRPNLKRRYGERLEAMYQQMDRKQQEELALLRRSTGISTLQRVAGALKANLGLATIDPASAQSYADRGGDSLGAVALSQLLEEMFTVRVPVSIILNPAGSANRLAHYIDAAKAPGGEARTPTFGAVHGDTATSVRASDLKLPKFFSVDMLATAAHAAPPSRETRTVLLTGATGFLGRFLCLEWLERLAPVNGKVICIIRAADAQAARARLDETFGTVDAALAGRFRMLAANHLEMIAGDLAAPRLGLNDADFGRLAKSVDHIVHPGALVNHLLSYRNLFEPNVVGTAELIRLALTERQKRFDYVSTVGVPHIDPELTRGSEDMDVRLNGTLSIPLRDTYASGYGTSKWAGEVLLREAHDLFGLPINVFRPDMIMPHSSFRGQINVPDMFTRMLFSIVMTGLAPGSFYELEKDGSKASAHYDGLPVDFIAATMQQISAQPHAGFKAYNIFNVHYDDGISLDRIVDWVMSAGYAVQRVKDHADWLQRFTGKLRQLPDLQRQHSSLTILGYFANPHPAHLQPLRSDNFIAAVRSIPAGPEVPHLSEAFIHKYLDDMRRLNLISEASRMVA